MKKALLKQLLHLGIFCLLVITVVGCSDASYLETFESVKAWEVEEYEGVKTDVVEERLHLTVDFPDSMFFATAGRRNLENGLYQLEVEAVEGSAESAYGMIFRATPNATDFYYFLVSADGFYSVGGCQNGCKDGDLIRIGDNMWTGTEAIATGLNQKHTLAVQAIGDQLTYSINGTEIGQFNNTSLAKGDIGVIVQTFDSSATVAFDNLSFTPIEGQ